ncbi:MAG: hypothetical protein J5726_07775 [Treponema sp.]|nr:hypothetical protein [Treponema sp.]
MKKFFSVLLSILFALCLLATLVLSVARNNFNTSTITELAGQIFKISKAPAIQFEDDGLFHPEQKIITQAQFNPSDYGDFDLSSIDLTNMDVNAIVQSYLEANEIDVDPQVVTQILASPEITQTVSQYADEIINYMTGTSDEINIDPSQLTKVVNTAIDKYEEATGEVVDRTGLDQAISQNVEAMVPELTATLDTAKEENAEAFDILKKVNFWLSTKIFVLAICVCVVLALIIFLINMNIFVCFKFISIPAIIDGFILFIAALVARGIIPSILQSVIADNALPQAVYDIAITYISKILFQIKLYGIITTILGVILCVLGFTLGKKKAVAAPAEQVAPVSQENPAE